MMFHVGVLYRIGGLLRFLHEHPISERQFYEDFSDWDGVCGQHVLKVAFDAGWVDKNPDDTLFVTPGGEELSNIGDPANRLRSEVMRLIDLLKPSWIRLAVRGRKAVETYAPPEAAQCLRESGLLTSVENSIIEWWDSLAIPDRAKNNLKLLGIGRRGEKLSTQYETMRTGHCPDWIAIDNSDAGYDILSRVSQENDSALMVEVKASEMAWEYADFYLSRNEWLVLSEAPHATLHLWSLKSEPPLMVPISMAQLRNHIPCDAGSGVWLQVRIPFSAVWTHDRSSVAVVPAS
jgi:hypothetical protein